jgi:serine/threonine protein kinase
VIAHRYRLVEQLGRGGMGVVWRAHDEMFGRDVAVKEVTLAAALAADERDRIVQSTLHEARIAARLSHPNVVKVYDVVESDNRPWIVMELVQARSLTEVVAEGGPLTPQRVASIGLQLLSGLMAAHAAGITHRDVKPGNVLCAQGGRVVLTDFGIASLEGDPSATGAGVLMGSPAYIAPERVRGGPARAASDIWSLAATLYTAVEGRPPYDRGNAVATVTAVVTDEPEPFRLAGPLAPVLNLIFVKDPDLRPDAAKVRKLLREVATRARTAPAAPGGAASRAGGDAIAIPRSRAPLSSGPRPRGDLPAAAASVPDAAEAAGDPPAESPSVPAAPTSRLRAARNFGLAAMSKRKPSTALANGRDAGHGFGGENGFPSRGGRGLAALAGGGLHSGSTRPRNLTLILAALSVVLLLAGSAAVKDMTRMQAEGPDAKPVEELRPVEPSESAEPSSGGAPKVVPSNAAERTQFPSEERVRYPVTSPRLSTSPTPAPTKVPNIPSKPAWPPPTPTQPPQSPTPSPSPSESPAPTPSTSPTPEDPPPPPPPPADVAAT